MKMIALLAAGLVAVSVVPAAANAQTRVVHTTTTTTVARTHHVRKAHWRTVCHTTWRHHHKVRTCNKVRRWY